MFGPGNWVLVTRLPWLPWLLCPSQQWVSDTRRYNLLLSCQKAPVGCSHCETKLWPIRMILSAFPIGTYSIPLISIGVIDWGKCWRDWFQIGCRVSAGGMVSDRGRGWVLRGWCQIGPRVSTEEMVSDRAFDPDLQPTSSQIKSDSAILENRHGTFCLLGWCSEVWCLMIIY